MACSGKEVTVREVDPARMTARETTCAADTGEPSQYTRRFLDRRALAPRYDSAPLDLLRELDRSLTRGPERELAFHLAELAYHRSLQAPAGSPEGFGLALAAAEYAWAYLFSDGLGAPASPYQRPFHWACELYNGAAARLVRDLVRHPQMDPAVATLRGTRRLERGGQAPGWSPEEFDSFLVAADYEVQGLSRLTRTDGLGVPCIALRTPPPLAERRLRERFLPPTQVAYAATVLLRFADGQSETGGGAARRVQLEIHDPMRTDAVTVDGRRVPLAMDLTTPLAYMLTVAPAYGEIGAVFRAEEWADRSGLVMLQPYQPGKIPAVFVHGLKSSPRRWTTLLNDLLADPVLRDGYQFWFFAYPSGNPYLYSAALLRESLRTVRQVYDPAGHDPAFDRMVVCGHSMGGLLTRTLIHDSGDRLWRRISDRTLDELELRPDQRELLSRTLFFRALPFVRRVIFVATPHRGAEMASGILGRLGVALSATPAWLAEIAEVLAPDDEELRGRLTGIANLRPDSAVLREIDTWPLPAGVAVHSVVGNQAAADTPGGSDGVVAYSSSHLEGANSEKIVRAGHSVQYHPAAIQEVRRILLQHLSE